MVRTAAIHTTFARNASCDGVCYVVGKRQGATTWTVGRVERLGDVWVALGVGAPSWTNHHGTRRAAVEAMEQGVLFRG